MADKNVIELFRKAKNAGILEQTLVLFNSQLKAEGKYLFEIDVNIVDRLIKIEEHRGYQIANAILLVIIDRKVENYDQFIEFLDVNYPESK